MTAQPQNCFVFCVVVVEFAVNGNQALREHSNGRYSKEFCIGPLDFMKVTYFFYFISQFLLINCLNLENII